MHFCKFVKDNGGIIAPLLIPSKDSKGSGLMNPSVLYNNDKIHVNLRNVNYTFYHSEKKLFQHQYGPLTYIHPEHDLHLRTTNWWLELSDDLKVTKYNKIDTTAFDTYEPQWDFVGLEDARIVYWDDNYWISGVRRDTTTNGQGRMELSKLEITENTVKEVERYRIEVPNDKNSYCEKNWMPIIDKPWHYIKWTNPTELVKVDKTTSKTVKLSNTVPLHNDQRGGSQVITLPNGNYLAITHEVQLFDSEIGRKDAVYLHRFIEWDKDFNIVHWSKEFSFMAGHVEFCTGMTLAKDSVLITFGFQDNAAFIIKTDLQTIMSYMNE